MSKEDKEEIEKCELCCYVRDMTNIKPAICEFHKGKIKGREEATQDFIRMIDKNPNFFINDDAQELFKQALKEKK